jgi:hypothetical protein
MLYPPQSCVRGRSIAIYCSSVFNAGTPLYVKQDSEDIIMKHSPTFRLSVSDVVLDGKGKLLVLVVVRRLKISRQGGIS